MFCGATEIMEPDMVAFQEGWVCHECLDEQEALLKAATENFAEIRKELARREALESKRFGRNNVADDFFEDMFNEHPSAEAEEAPRKVPSPREIKDALDQHVVGQEDAKRVISVAVHNHYKRIFSKKPEIDREFKDVEIEKSNILLLGPTGSGKTLIARTLARILDVPFAIADATALTEAGYVGEDVENILLSLIQAADGDVEKAQRGIVFIDEIDKIGRRTENVSITRDVSGEGVQQALLKILEGTVAHVPPAGGRKHPEQRYIEIETKDILFICGGAFVGLDTIMRRRSLKQHFGFVSSDAPAAQTKDASGRLRPEPEDLIQYGLIPEFVGRLPIVSVLTELTEDELVHILTRPRNSLVRQYRKLFAYDGVDLQFEDAALRSLAREALKRKTGARGLRAILEELMVDVMFDISAVGLKPGTKLVITADMVDAQFAKGGQLVDMLRKAKKASAV
jgi:ATP-dependent Clp protease ATP-binding subunit ClpX